MLLDKIESDFKTALKAKEVLKVETLRMLKAALGNFLIEKRKQKPDDVDLIALIQKQVKLRQDSIESFSKGGRKDLVDKETKEKAILESYLPSRLSDAELENLVRKVIQDLGATAKTQMGAVMKEALSRAQGRAEGKRVNEAAARFLP